MLSVADEAVRVVVDDQDIVPGAEVDDPLEQFRRGGLSRRHVGIIDQHHLHAVESRPFDGLEVRIEIRLLVERIGQHLASGQPHGGRIGRITRVGDQHLVARIEERHADMHDALLRTDQRQHLRIVVQLGAVPLPIPVGKSLAQNRLALVGHVFVDVGALGFLRQPVDDRPMGRQVGTAHGQLDDLAARGGLELRKFAQAAREIVLPDTVQTVRTGDVYCFCHSLCCVFGICFGQR